MFSDDFWFDATTVTKEVSVLNNLRTLFFENEDVDVEGIVDEYLAYNDEGSVFTWNSNIQVGLLFFLVQFACILCLSWSFLFFERVQKAKQAKQRVNPVSKLLSKPKPKDGRPLLKTFFFQTEFG